MATGPPMIPPMTSPNVAVASPTAGASVTPKTSTNRCPHAAPVPCPPAIVTEPAMRPITGSTPIAFATPMPMMFSMKSMPTTHSVNSTSATPPLASERASAPRPIVAKNASMSPGCIDVSKVIRNADCVEHRDGERSDEPTHDRLGNGVFAEKLDATR